MRTRTAVGVVLAGLLLLVVTVAGVYTVVHDRRATAAQQVPAAPTLPADPAASAIEAAQERLADVPGDHATWAQLGSAYVERARVTADPSFYAKAEGALAESLALRPEGNDTALTGQGALANARHDFAAAADLAGRALEINPYSATAWGVLTDARTQLGDHQGATDALGRMLQLRPGIASFARASYDAELHGDRPAARSAMEQALDSAQAPGDVAFCRTQLGALAFADGDLDGAAAHFEAGLAAVPGDPELTLGMARLRAARGDVDGAIAAFQFVVDARPLPEHAVEYGEYLLSLGRDDEARQQFALVETIRQLFAAGGVSDDLSTALFAADHGDPATALAAAEAEFARRQNADAHDAMAWALHVNGRDAEALGHAEQATSLGGASALFRYHRGVIEAALGRTDQARASLARALDTGPYFSPLHAPRAEQLLTELGGRP